MRSRKTRRAALVEAVEPRRLLSTIYVDANATGATHDGASWNSAYQDLQQGLAAAVSGDEIHVADGTYKPTGGTDRTISFVLKSGVSIFGGYAGDGASNPSARDVAGNVTILSGDIGTTGDIADNSYHVVTSVGIGTAASIDGLSVILGNANGNTSAQSRGGGLYLDGSDWLALNGCTFRQNAAVYGGGIYAYSNLLSSPILAGCIFRENAAKYGGGMYNDYNTVPRLTGCTFSGNTASTYGGAVFNGHAAPMLSSCMFDANTAARYGGGMYNSYNSSPALVNCTFIRNTASLGAGGMFNDSSSPTLTNCVFNGNESRTGGGMYNAFSWPILNNCTFSGNAATDSGGGVYNSGQSYDGTPIFNNCTFSGNTANSYGAAVYNERSSPSLIHCIVWTSGDKPIFNETGAAAPTVTYSDVQGGYAGIGNIDSAPKFIRSPWAGSDGAFGTTDDDYGDLRLRSNSPCLDVGSNSNIPAGVTTDLQGNPRIQNGTVDLGAYEGMFAAPAPKVIYVDFNSVGSNSGTSWADAYTSLQSAILTASEGDTIRIADGVYKPTSGMDRTISIGLKSGVSILGGYAGFGAPNPNARDRFSFGTILSGDIGTMGNVADNSYNVVTAIGIGVATVIDGVTVSLGNANEGGSRLSCGGGLFVAHSSSLTLVDCTFTKNIAYTGGGIFNTSFSSPVLTNCIFRGNTSNNVGGMYNDMYSSPILENCIFSGNSNGGMRNNMFSSAILTNCVFVGCSGGAIYNSSYSSPRLTNCIFSGNVRGEGAAVVNDSFCAVVLANCIIWGNSSNPIRNLSSTPTIKYSSIQGGYSGTGNINADPLFVRNPSPGVDGTWGTADDDYGDLRLRAGSPCIDAGNNAAVQVGVTTDLAGNPRIVDAPGVRDFGERVDMGAYEYLPALTYQADAAKPTLRMSFALDVDPTTLSAGDLVLLNITNGQPLSTSGAAVSYDSNTRIATWQFSGALPDGDYRATLPAGSVSDTSGTPLAGDSLCNFFTLGGDANRDRLVDIKDLYILATNWQGNGKLFSQGDFNYDGKVDAADLGILSARWQQNLPPPVAPVPASIAKVAKRSPVRMVSVVG